jgi:hypothetical protein
MRKKATEVMKSCSFFVKKKCSSCKIKNGQLLNLMYGKARKKSFKKKCGLLWVAMIKW